MVNERTPLRLLSVSGIPTIGEFQSGDVVAILKGGTGTSSLLTLKDNLGINDLTLSSSLDDIDPSLRAGISLPSTGNSLVWTGSFWGASAITGGGGVTDHGALTGLSDNDHPQYTLSSTNNALSSLVTSIETSTVALSSYVSTNEALWASATPASTLDHGGLQGLGDNDHPQYTLSSTNNALSSLVTSVETSTVALSSYVSTNEALWASATPASTLDHGGLQGLGDDDHTQYLLATGSRVATGSISIESTDSSPPSNPVALVLKTIDSSPTNDTNIGEIRFAEIMLLLQIKYTIGLGGLQMM